MEIHYCDLCGEVLKEKRNVLMIMPDTPLKEEKSYRNPILRKDTQEICDKCLDLFKDVFKYKKDKINELRSWISHKYSPENIKIKKDLIICIIGESGSGKTLISEYIEKLHGIKMIESWTDRPKRYAEEKGHSWATKKEFDKFKKSDMIAFTKFGGNRYCCLKQDVKDYNTYVIDENGLDYLKANFSHMYNIKSIRLVRDYGLRKLEISTERLHRDMSNFNKPFKDFDYIVRNNETINDLKDKIDNIIPEILKEHDYADERLPK